MASRGPDIQERLREGIEAARKGDRVTARRLLQQVLILDRDNEVALMWMASVVENVNERRAFLERTLKVNPNNARAREALQRMGGSVPGGSTATDGSAGATRVGRAGSTQTGTNPYLVAAAVVGVITIAIVLISLLAGQSTQTQEEIAQATMAAFLAAPATESSNQEAAAETVATTVPTETPFIGVLVTLDPNQVNLPATFTPTDTPEPTLTSTATSTAIPPSTYRLLYAGYSENSDFPGLFRARGNGTGVEVLGNPAEGFSDVALSPDGELLAFVREVSGESGTAPQLFVAPLANLTEAAPITNQSGSTLMQPAWSPDGTQIAFVSDQDGDSDIWVVDSSGENLRSLTDNGATDSGPAWSPDGTMIAYASDINSPGYTEIYQLNLETNLTSRLSDEAGSNYDPVYSPDGSRIAFVSTQGGDGDIYIMDADGQRKFLLTVDDEGAEDRYPRFTPDGAYLAFISNREDIFMPYLLDLRSGSVTPILDSSEDIQSITFIPNTR